MTLSQTRRFPYVLALLAAAGVFLSAGRPAHGEVGTIAVIHHFSIPTPSSGLIQGSDGNYYGTTSGAGSAGYGTVYKMTAAGVVTTLHSFNLSEGAAPRGNLLQASDGNFYGTTEGGGAYDFGTVFQLTPTGVFRVLHTFDDAKSVDGGAGPVGALVEGEPGVFYGTTSYGGTINSGIVYRITRDGAYTSLQDFADSGTRDVGYGLTKGKDGSFYGLSDSGGPGGGGTVFRVTTAGVVAILHGFGFEHPQGKLVFGNDGNLYGTTTAGGSSANGTFFRVTTAGVFTNLHEFTGTDGTGSVGGLILGRDGNFYGSFTTRGPNDGGGVYRITPGGTVTTLHGFVFGGNDLGNHGPDTPLVQGSDGFFYGTTPTSGDAFEHGSIFRVSTAGAFTTLNTFPGSDGQVALGGLIQGKDGNLYGTTSDGGDHDDGNIYRVTPTGVTTTLHSFDEKDGTDTTAGLVQASDGNFYGVSDAGGTNFLGTIFRVTPSGAFSVLRNLSSADGNYPQSALIQAADGNLYGVAPQGGSGGGATGTAFRITLGGVFSVLHNFDFKENASPYSALVQGADGNFYGTTYASGVNNDGSIYRLSPAGALTTLHSFNGADGSRLFAPLVVGADGNFYGSTIGGGLNDNGTIFRMTNSGAVTVLQHLTDSQGTVPAALVPAPDGYLYGVSTGGGENGLGQIFRLTTGGSFTPLRSFEERFDGLIPDGTLVRAGDGTFYGILAGGVVSGPGGVFKYSSVPALTSASTATATVGAAFAYQTTATNNPMRFSASGLPSGLSIGITTGQITGAPATMGTYTVKLALSNGISTGAATLTVIVKGAAPVITGSLNPPSRLGVPFAYQITATNNPANYATQGLPAGLGLSAATGKISGTPAKAGTYRVIVKATNANGTGSATLNIVVKAAVPVIDGTLSVSGQTGVAFAYQIRATNSPTSYGASGLPGGLSINQNTGQITGKPAKVGTYTATLKASNSGGSGLARLTITVKAGISAITSALGATATVGKAFAYQIEGTNAPANYGASGLPAGLSINQSTGVISGTPEVAGSYTVTIAASNTVGKGSAKVALTVKPAA